MTYMQEKNSWLYVSLDEFCVIGIYCKKLYSTDILESGLVPFHPNPDLGRRNDK